MPEAALDEKLNSLRREMNEELDKLEKRQNERMELILKPIANALTNLSESQCNFQEIVSNDIKGILQEQQAVSKRLDAHCTAEETAAKIKLEAQQKKDRWEVRYRWIIGTLIAAIGLMLGIFNFIKAKHEGWISEDHPVVHAEQKTQQADNK